MPLQMEGSLSYPKGSQRASTLAQRPFSLVAHATRAHAVYSESIGAILSRREKIKRLTLKRKKKENLHNAA